MEEKAKKENKIERNLLFLFFIITILDQAIKNLIRNSSYSLSLWGDFLKIYETKNYGIFTGFSFNYSEIVLIFILLLLFFVINSYKEISFYFYIIIFGVVSNFIDRVRFDYIVDYINIAGISHFNIADLLIYTGAILIIIRLTKKPREI